MYFICSHLNPLQTSDEGTLWGNLWRDIVSHHPDHIESQREGLRRILRDPKHTFLGADGMLYEELKVLCTERWEGVL